MYTSNTKRLRIISSLLLVAAAPPTFAQSLNAVANPVVPPSRIGILPPNPAPSPPSIKPQPQPPALDNSVYTSYRAYGGGTSVYWFVCGNMQSITGCFGAGTLGPFGKIGAMIEGDPSTNSTKGTVTRNIYVVDEAANGGAGVVLYVYQKTDAIEPTMDTITTTLTNTITLPLVGGQQATTFMAANKTLLYIGTSQGQNFVQVNKSNLTFTSMTGPSTTISSITADQYGYVTIAGGTNVETAGFSTYDPSGSFVEGGGGDNFVLSTTNGLSVGSNSNVISSIAQPNIAERMKLKFQKTNP